MIRQNFGKQVFITPKGLEDAKLELNILKTEKRLEVAEKIGRAREFGDITENSEYDAALDEQAIIESRIAELEELLKNAELITTVMKSDEVVLGSTIALEMDGKKDEFTIVGRVEADPMKKKISNESPLGSKLLGTKVGEVIEVQTPGGSYQAKILAIK